jgi:general secretion pathway protein B
MSILLDALRKSEAQRQLGKTPTLQTPAVSGESAGGDSRIWIPVMMLLLTGGLIWWMGAAQYQRADPVTAEPASTLAESEQTVKAQQVKAGMPAPQQGDNTARESAERSAKTPVMNFSQNKSRPVASGAPGKRSAVNAGKKANLPSPTAQSDPAEQATPAAEETLAAARTAALPSGNKHPGTAEKEQGQTDRLEPFVAPSIGYWQVPQSVRQDLPEMHITVLVYAEKPQDRFLLINGQRLHEQEALGDGLVLEEIQRDRAIFTYRSYRFHLID